MTTRTWSGANGSFSDATQWSGGAVPSSGDIATINSGTVNAASLTAQSLTLNLNGTSSGAGTLTLANASFDASSVVTVTDSNAFGSSPEPTLALQGVTTNNGTLNFLGSTPIVTFAAGASLVNTGTISINGSSPQIQTTGSAGAITNNGTISVTNPNGAYQSVIVNATISGTGTINIGNAGAVALRQSVSAGQTVAFTGGVNAGSALEIDSSSGFGATVSGFVQGDQLQVTSIPYTSFTYTSTGSSGTLTLLNGSTTEGTIKLSGIYSQSTFTVTANPLGSTGLDNVIISTAVTNSSTGASSGSTGTVGAVYRFFDNTNGTHFFTSDIGERNTVLSTLASRYTEETNGFGDVTQADPNETPVYRFFDTKYGTHFFTASANERDTILNTRPDLTYEPGSTFYEHATQQSGDVSVYRFFDTQFGTHFYTGDSNEYAGLTTPGTSTYRSNLTYEGVGFYAPKGSFT